MPSLPSPRPRHRHRLEIIPFIDVMFFLLATFMMVSLSMIKNEGIPVTLPAASTGSRQDRNESISISIKSNGDIYYNQEPISPNQLPERLHSLKQSVQDPKIFINGDGKAFF